MTNAEYDKILKAWDTGGAKAGIAMADEIGGLGGVFTSRAIVQGGRDAGNRRAITGTVGLMSGEDLATLQKKQISGAPLNKEEWRALQTANTYHGMNADAAGSIYSGKNAAKKDPKSAKGAAGTSEDILSASAFQDANSFAQSMKSINFKEMGAAFKASAQLFDLSRIQKMLDAADKLQLPNSALSGNISNLNTTISTFDTVITKAIDKLLGNKSVKISEETKKENRKFADSWLKNDLVKKSAESAESMYDNLL
jgi:hypothetical protein